MIYTIENEFYSHQESENSSYERELCLVEHFLNLYHSGEKNIYWNGSVTDLIEICYRTYSCGRVRDEQGYPMSMQRLVKKFCAFVHLPMPYNPYSIAHRAINRKGLRRPSYLERFFWQYNNGVENPIENEIERV